MFGNMGDMSKMLEGLQENAAKLQAQLESKTFSVKSGGGLIELSVNGKGEVVTKGLPVEKDDAPRKSKRRGE